MQESNRQVTSQEAARIAWIVLWSAFALFVALLLGMVAAAKRYYDTAVVARSTALTVLAGTVLTRSENPSLWASAPPEALLREGDSLRTDQSSRALLRLFEGSTTGVFSGTDLRLAKLASLRFGEGRETVRLVLERGKLEISVSPRIKEARTFLVSTPHADLYLEEGSYSVTAYDNRTHVRARERGAGSVRAGGQEVSLKAGERVEIGGDGLLGPPEAAPEELVLNGDFVEGFQGWQVGNYLGFPEGQDITGQAQVIPDAEQPALRFLRQGSKGTHCETYLLQEIGRDVSDFSELWLSVEMNLVHQNLGGGGYMGTEYPLILRVGYRSTHGASFVIYGFYYQNEANNRTDLGEQVSHNTWQYQRIAQNLMTLSPPPQEILSIQVSASGWDYESLVRNISLTGK